MNRRKRSDVNYMEFRDGYVLVNSEELAAIIEGYRKRDLRRDELRLFAAMCEQKGLHRRSKVDIAHIVNCKSGMKGIRRLARGEIEKAQAKVRAILESSPHGESKRRIAVSRKMLKHAARGRGTSNETIVMLFYCMRRLPQERRLRRLERDERYARFTYRNLEEVSGIPRANICRAVARLRNKGFLNTPWVQKQNENKYGLLFVDGPLVSLSCPRQGPSRRQKPRSHATAASLDKNDNSPQHKSTTLINDNPKKNNQIGTYGVFARSAVARASRKTEFERIKQRAEQVRAELVEQAA